MDPKTNLEKIANDKKSMEGREKKKRYEAEKKKVKEIEKTNRSRIIAFRSTRDWWKIGGHSALIYYYRIAPRLGKDVNLMNDMDYFSTFSTGVISIRSIEEFEEELSKLGIKLEKETEAIKSFKLPKALSETELKKLKEQEKQKLEKVNKIVMSEDNEVDPLMWAEIRELEKMSFGLYSKIKPGAREVFYEKMIDNMRTISAGYLSVTDKQNTQSKEILMIIRRVIKRMLNDIRMLTNEKQLPLNSGAKMGESLAKLKEMVEKKLKV